MELGLRCLVAVTLIGSACASIALQRHESTLEVPASEGIWEETYTAAVLQSVPKAAVANGTSTVDVLKAIDENYERYAHFARIASRHNDAQIMVFPEDGLYPDPCYDGGMAIISNAAWSYVLQPEDVLAKLSCLAIETSMVLVFCMYEMIPCNGNDAACPSDGHYQLNTQYAVDESGAVIQKYHKVNLWVTEHHAYSETGGEGTDPAPFGPELKYFDTSFGVRFGMFICFDIFYPVPGMRLAAGHHSNPPIRNFVFSSYWMWVPRPPMLPAIAVQQGWSRMAGTNFISANVGTGNIAGSGIFSIGQPLVARYSPSKEEDEALLVARVPKHPGRNMPDALVDHTTRYSYSDVADQRVWISEDLPHAESATNDKAASDNGLRNARGMTHAVNDHTSLLIFSAHECPGSINKQGICVVTHAHAGVRCTLGLDASRADMAKRPPLFYTLGVLSGPFFAAPTAAGRAACVLYSCQSSNDCLEIWDVSDNNITDERTLSGSNGAPILVDLRFDYASVDETRVPDGAPGLWVLPAVVVNGMGISSQWDYWHDRRRRQAGVEFGAGSKDDLGSGREHISHAMLVLL